MGDPVKQARGTDDTGTSGGGPGGWYQRALDDAVRNAKLPVLKRSDYIDNAFNKISRNPILHTYALYFQRLGVTFWVEVGADELGWSPGIEHPTQFTGWNRPTKVVDQYYHSDDYLAAFYYAESEKSKAAQVDRTAAMATAFVSFNMLDADHGRIILPTVYTRVTAPRLFNALVRLHGERPISQGEREGWIEVGEVFERGVEMAAVIPAVRGAGLLARAAAGRVAATATGAAALARAAALEVRVTVSTYGYSPAAALYLGRSAYTFYLINAVPISAGVVAGADIAFSLVGEDTGMFNQGDVVEFAVPGGKAGWQVVKAEVSAEKTAERVVVKVSSVVDTTAENAARNYGSGRHIHHTPKAPPRDLPAPAVGARQIENKAASAASRGTQADDAARVVAQGKPNKAAALKSTLPPPNINLRELIAEAEVEKLVQQGFKREALDKLRHAEVGELERVGLLKSRGNDYEALRQVQAKISQASASQKADEVARLRKEQGRILQRIAAKEQAAVDLYTKLRASAAGGGLVKDFVNEFWDKPGFQEAVLGWARGGLAQQGANFMMKYALGKFKNQAVRFEWGVGRTKTADGRETWARYVDIVVDGGTGFRPGEALRIEVKKWSEWYLSRDSTRDKIAKQLIRDTAFFAREQTDPRTGDTARWLFDNIRWVFDSSQVKAEQVTEVFVKVILDDAFLKNAWGGTEEKIRATLKNVIETYP